MKSVVVVVLLTFFIGYALSTAVQSCSGGPHPLSDSIIISNCTTPPCRLRRNSNVSLELRIKPDQDVPSLRNTVYARISGVPFPFLGVDQTDACPQIYHPDGSKAGCPLKAGQEYVYRNSFPVLQLYPRLRVSVHWALTAPGNRDLICFNVPARITT